MLDVVLPVVIAATGALLAAIPFVVERRRARPPASLRMAAIFFAAWGIRDVVYGAVAHPAFWVRIAAGVAAVAAGGTVLGSTFAPSKALATAALAFGIAHLILAALDVFLVH